MTAVLDTAGAQLVAGLRGLPPGARFSIIATSGGSVWHFVPETAEARGLAELLLSRLLCHGYRTGTLTWALRRAFDERPDMVVLIGDGLGEFDRAEAERVKRQAPELLPTYKNPLAEIPGWPNKAPVIAISLAAGEPASELRQLAELTGGVYVSAAP